MPPGVAVVDAFKNLIRHGKNHIHVRQDDFPNSQQPAAPPTDARSQPERRQQAEPQPQSQPKQQQAQKAQPATTKQSQHITREVEKIVREEREAMDKMPTYKGLERYKLIEKKGDGAFSNVYKALDLSLGTHVAVKAVRKFELTPSQRANILKEVQIMRGTSNSSVIKLISFIESPDHYFLILELVDGGELFHQIVKLTYFSENLSRHVILQVARGIRYLHEERGVVHRDIKPENLLFEQIPIIPSKNPVIRQYDEEKEDEGEFVPGVGGGGIGRVKIADFGLSKVIWNEETKTPCGTVGYTAPEIVKDERYSKSVDMWALGCVLYTLLCGFPPFYDESINVLTEKVARGHYTFLSPWWDDVSLSAKDLITHLLCVDPAQRYTIDEFLTHPWCNAAPAPMPEPTPRADNLPMDSPLLHAVRRGRDGRSPGIASLKEAFDITFAVHRMEEEGARRRAYKGRGGAGQAGFLAGLNEDDENLSDEETTDPSRSQGQQQQQQPREMYDGRAGQRDMPRRHGRPFELSIDGATLLGRRQLREAQDDIPLDLSPLAMNPKKADAIDVPRGPMQY